MIQVSDEIYKLDEVAITMDGTKIENPENVKDLDSWYTTTVYDKLC